ncbi:hypothetical protein [Parafrankia sp. EUN1f]|uniref:hypothetical protein n=1 Tax=Parafrankia sp. EUN1f TaxID=102897 RepID=UPI0005681CED|nr:hypothetical protein [Parafrankia sp. EUN1f]
MRWYLIAVLDGLIVTGAVALLAWIAVLEKATEAGPPTEGPLSSAVLAAASLIVSVVVILTGASPRGRAELALGLLVAGLLMVTTSFTWYASSVVRGLADVPRLFDLFLIPEQRVDDPAVAGLLHARGCHLAAGSAVTRAIPPAPPAGRERAGAPVRSPPDAGPPPRPARFISPPAAGTHPPNGHSDLLSGHSRGTP